MLLDIAVQYFAQSAEIGHSIGRFASVSSMHAHEARRSCEVQTMPSHTVSHEAYPKQ